MTLSLAPARPGGHPQSVFVRLADILVGHDVVENAGNNDIEHNKHYDVDIQIFQDDVNTYCVISQDLGHGSVTTKDL